MALRLDSLGAAESDALAHAYAGFLRAERMFQSGEPEQGLAESMRAASRIQEAPEPRIRAPAALELCDNYNMADNAGAALPFCERSSAAWRTFGDTFEVARALNLEAHARHGLGDREVAALRFDEARRLFLRNGTRTSPLRSATTGWSAPRWRDRFRLYGFVRNFIIASAYSYAAAAMPSVVRRETPGRAGAGINPTSA